MLAKKAEAAQRRRMQVEKATKESEVGEKSFLTFSINIWHVSVSRSHQLCLISAGRSYKENIGHGLWQEERREEAKGARREGLMIIWSCSVVPIGVLLILAVTPCWANHFLNTGASYQSTKHRGKLGPLGHGAHRNRYFVSTCSRPPQHLRLQTSQVILTSLILCMFVPRNCAKAMTLRHLIYICGNEQLPSSTGEMRWAIVHQRLQVQALQAEPPPLQPQMLQGRPRKCLIGLRKHDGVSLCCCHWHLCLEIRHDESPWWCAFALEF